MCFCREPFITFLDSSVSHPNLNGLMVGLEPPAKGFVFFDFGMNVEIPPATDYLKGFLGRICSASGGQNV